MRCGMKGYSPAGRNMLESIKKLVAWLVAEGALAMDRITVASLLERYQAGMVSFRFDPKDQTRIIAVCVAWPTKDAATLELGSVSVHEDFRENRLSEAERNDGHIPLSEQVFAECTQIIRDSDCQGIIFTCNKTVSNLAEKYGWKLDAAGDCQRVRSMFKLGPYHAKAEGSVPPIKFFCI